MNITLEYDGHYPNQCSGLTAVIIDGIRFEFPHRYCLASGGSVWFGENWEEYVEEGEWSLTAYPPDLPEEYHEAVLEEINTTIPWGCCGGCI